MAPDDEKIHNGTTNRAFLVPILLEIAREMVLHGQWGYYSSMWQRFNEICVWHLSAPPKGLSLNEIDRGLMTPIQLFKSFEAKEKFISELDCVKI